MENQELPSGPARVDAQIKKDGLAMPVRGGGARLAVALVEAMQVARVGLNAELIPKELACLPITQLFDVQPFEQAARLGGAQRPVETTPYIKARSTGALMWLHRRLDGEYCLQSALEIAGDAIPLLRSLAIIT
jgi:hypothetical protein